MSEEIITLTNVFSVTCFGCDGYERWLSADVTITGELVRLYCPICNQPVVHPKPSKWAIALVKQIFIARSKRENNT